jgi:hypothetical protein
MAIEIIASRIIAPFMGNSVVVWTSFIGVILAALSRLIQNYGDVFCSLCRVGLPARPGGLPYKNANFGRTRAYKLS